MQRTKYCLTALRNHPLTWGCLLLAAITILNNWPVAFFDFAWDDHGYVVRNYPIQDPISLKSIAWCLTAFAEANWHPITWLALHIEFQFFGLKPFGYHIVNLILHLVNVLLLFGALRRMTGATGKSLAVAALFAVHPLHVESVAWISEIKDVLSTLFLMLTLHAYTTYAKRPTLGRYLRVALALALGLAAKPMLVTVPFALLLVDAWPLGRWTRGPFPARPGLSCPRYDTARLIGEKVPLLFLVAATCVLTFQAQREGGAVADLNGLPINFRLGNVANSYVLYLWRMLWPWPLSFFYPLGSLSLIQVILCGTGLISASAVVYLVRRRLPFLIVGWLWFLGTLVPVIGFIQVGSQALADRYMYIPSIGLLVAGVWLADALRCRLRLSLLLPSVLSCAFVFTAMLVSFAYLRHWANEIDLYSYALDINDNNVVAHNNYGNILSNMGKIQEATRHYKKALYYSPNSPLALNNLAMLNFRLGNYIAAVTYLNRAIDTNYNFSISYLNLAFIYIATSNDLKAEKCLRQALDLDNRKLPALNLLGELLVRHHHDDEALKLFRQGLDLSFKKDPAMAYFYNNIGGIELRRNNYIKATEAFQNALKLQPQFLLALINLARTQMKQNDFTNAMISLTRSLALTPHDPNVLCLLGNLALDQKQYARAYKRYRQSLAVNPDISDAHDGLAAVLRAFGRTNDANIHAAAANELRLHPRSAAKLISANNMEWH